MRGALRIASPALWTSAKWIAARHASLSCERGVPHMPARDLRAAPTAAKRAREPSAQRAQGASRS